ncbi:hypothetical protein [Kineosporia sp. NBRC 101731]|uniref:hypothetical protein n=1 Tax=Kineosporia sp. NBRC 101731 TaxID=3032199 RepID=UPI0024A4CD93|nr:hypothetical protein [Kineosporia sp. NBRC 101731]GLY28283.1 hypothetical protein Kisp02_16480 [Kineosporia sp. NBRC 101731]
MPLSDPTQTELSQLPILLSLLRLDHLFQISGRILIAHFLAGDRPVRVGGIIKEFGLRTTIGPFGTGTVGPRPVCYRIII